MYIAFRDPAERLSVSQRVAVDNTITEFNGWVSDLEVEEVQCVGRKFTWYRPNGAAKSKLDRFFVSDAWISKWPESTYLILNRNFSDHCPILLRSRIVDWGPKRQNFRKPSQRELDKLTIKGVGGYSLKEKIKKLKERMKQWNKQQFGDTLKKVQQIEYDLNKLEAGSNGRQLSTQELAIREKLQEDLWTAAQSHESLMRQKA